MNFQKSIDLLIASVPQHAKKIEDALRRLDEIKGFKTHRQEVWVLFNSLKQTVQSLGTSYTASHHILKVLEKIQKISHNYSKHSYLDVLINQAKILMQELMRLQSLRARQLFSNTPTSTTSRSTRTAVSGPRGRREFRQIRPKGSDMTVCSEQAGPSGGITENSTRPKNLSGKKLCVCGTDEAHSHVSTCNENLENFPPISMPVQNAGRKTPFVPRIALPPNGVRSLGDNIPSFVPSNHFDGNVAQSKNVPVSPLLFVPPAQSGNFDVGSPISNHNGNVAISVPAASILVISPAQNNSVGNNGSSILIIPPAQNHSSLDGNSSRIVILPNQNSHLHTNFPTTFVSPQTNPLASSIPVTVTLPPKSPHLDGNVLSAILNPNSDGSRTTEAYFIPDQPITDLNGNLPTAFYPHQNMNQTSSGFPFPSSSQIVNLNPNVPISSASPILPSAQNRDVPVSTTEFVFTSNQAGQMERSVQNNFCSNQFVNSAPTGTNFSSSNRITTDPILPLLPTTKRTANMDRKVPVSTESVFTQNRTVEIQSPFCPIQNIHSVPNRKSFTSSTKTTTPVPVLPKTKTCNMGTAVPASTQFVFNSSQSENLEDNVSLSSVNILKDLAENFSLSSTSIENGDESVQIPKFTISFSSEALKTTADDSPSSIPKFTVSFVPETLDKSGPASPSLNFDANSPVVPSKQTSDLFDSLPILSSPTEGNSFGAVCLPNLDENISVSSGVTFSPNDIQTLPISPEVTISPNQIQSSPISPEVIFSPSQIQMVPVSPAIPPALPNLDQSIPPSPAVFSSSHNENLETNNTHSNSSNRASPAVFSPNNQNDHLESNTSVSSQNPDSCESIIAPMSSTVFQSIENDAEILYDDIPASSTATPLPFGSEELFRQLDLFKDDAVLSELALACLEDENFHNENAVSSPSSQNENVRVKTPTLEEMLCTSSSTPTTVISSNSRETRRSFGDEDVDIDKLFPTKSVFSTTTFDDLLDSD